MDLTAVVTVVFAATYAGIALGRLPGLAIDRTGIALLGAIALLVSGAMDAGGAVAKVDLPTILLLYGLMVLSAQLRVAGFYTRVALAVSGAVARPRRFLLQLMAVAAGLSAVLANDIVCLAFTPVLVAAVTGAGLNPVPFLLGLAMAANIGSAATIIGNPQNMLIGQVAGLSFAAFFQWCVVPSLVSLLLAYLVLCLAYRNRWQAAPGAAPGGAGHWPAFNAHQAAKGLILTAVMVALFFTRIPREVTAAAVAGLLLCSRTVTTRALLGLVDFHLLTLFCALFIVTGAAEDFGLAQKVVAWAAEAGVDLGRPLDLTLVTVVLSNVVSNVPAVMLLLKRLGTAPPEHFYLLALASTLAGNCVTVGSIANLITIEQARACGVHISFTEHARVGVVITLLSIAVVLAWHFSLA